MKFFKGLVVFLLVVIIAGGTVFLAYSLYFGKMMSGNSMNMASDNTKNTTTNNSDKDKDSMNMSNDMNISDSSSDNMNQTTSVPNPQDAKNREKLNKAINLINKAMDQITIDPYSNATVAYNSNMQMNSNMTSQGTGTINIYPSENSSVNITPKDSTKITTDTQSTMTGMNMGGSKQNTQNMQDTKYVYDQVKLQQLHNGIYTMAQGMLAIDQLNNSLLDQSMTLEQQPLSYQTYVLRYNNSLKNETDLENIMNLLDSASVLINVNPYASDSGYEIDKDSMKKLNEGVYKLAQGMAILESLKTDFISQMSSASMSAQNLAYGTGMANMSGVSGSGSGLFGNISINMILNFVLVILVIGFIIGIIGTILKLFRNKPQGGYPDREENHNE
ncbi:hypothetical protein [Anaeromicropila herbilytica]|uniref:Uncharacterized protein n=1 Tax=Anaeromicropila herbilytica TaxID=2785025 RepID=A0A7R7IBE7_9FIRM|nr:hypothetical protein [Anaeromicropila herbilytica]BCN29568.1 hypothetical protein bsdtb5_08630 [Anaeromicropila herbilytica]